MPEFIQVEQRGNIKIVTLNRPDALNAISYKLAEEFHAVLDDIKYDMETRVLIITGIGRSFCAGADLKERQSYTPEERGRKTAEMCEIVTSLFEKIEMLEVPTIAAINGFCLGGGLDPAIELAEKGNVQYLGFDHLAELTMCLLHKQKQKDPTKGYIPDITGHFKALLPACQKNGVKMITDAGGANPHAAADAVAALAADMGYKGMKLGVLTGDDLTDKLDEIRAAGVKLTNTDTGEEDIDRVKDKIVAAYAYMGCDAIVDALDQGCDHVIAGRVSDVSLYVAPLMHEFGWDFSDKYINKLGAAVNAGHIAECGCPCTGGISNLWKISPDNHKIGFPIIEMDENGDAIITKVPGSGGLVNEWTVKEHLVYEVMDPRNYIMPDGIADFSTLKLQDLGNDRVKITNMTGKGRPDMLKVCIGVEEGFIGEGTLLFPWPDAYGKAKKAEEIMRKRIDMLGIELDELRFDYIGVNTLAGRAAPEPSYDMNECGLRVSAKAKTFAAADAVRRAVTHIWTFGPIGTSCGVPAKTRKVVGLWPTLVPREFVVPKLEIKEVK